MIKDTEYIIYIKFLRLKRINKLIVNDITTSIDKNDDGEDIITIVGKLKHSSTMNSTEEFMSDICGLLK